MKKRSICSRCHYPQNVCVCGAISCITIPLQLVVLQHPLETRHAKNTARLIPLCIPNTQTFVGQSEQDFTELKQQLVKTNKTAWVLYPNSQSQPLEDYQQHYPDTLPDVLIVIDATWRKATKMWQLNPWLHVLPSWHFNALPENQYRIRKTQLAHSLSTLEAAAQGLKILTKRDVKPLLRLFDEMQIQQEKHMPKHG
ncbi:tRNA-uridine aminocarboxypropyltransferase [Aliiglaciecola lipolytica]|uniref:tRNA-uridine aminocarboxypropyltransferase n=1 Tax=Aliiglaciecola lipolytica TaxID=477689 RepID=UPI00058EF255|nr:tRNA-uridine aminocarboxypropyltransferase [Aliiglaciecola lipolytica]